MKCPACLIPEHDQCGGEEGMRSGCPCCADTYYRALVIDGVPAASPDMIEAAFAPTLFFEEED